MALQLFVSIVHTYSWGSILSLGYCLCGVFHVVPLSELVHLYSPILLPPKNMLVNKLATLNCPRCKRACECVCMPCHPGWIPALCLVSLRSPITLTGIKQFQKMNAWMKESPDTLILSHLIRTWGNLLIMIFLLIGYIYKKETHSFIAVSQLQQAKKFQWLANIASN